MRIDLEALIAQAYRAPEWAVFFEVSDVTGFGAQRRADAVALGIWPSRGHTLIGFECKTDRRDWLRELKNPAKAERISAACDEWYLVTSDQAIAKVEELPEPWGLLVATGGKLRRIKPAVPFQRDREVVRRSFAAAMLRKVGERMVAKAEVDAIVAERVRQAVERTNNGRQLEQANANLAELNRLLETFKAHSGIDLRHDYHGPARIGAAVRSILQGDGQREQLRRSAASLQAAARVIEDAVATWPETLKPEPEEPTATGGGD